MPADRVVLIGAAVWVALVSYGMVLEGRTSGGSNNDHAIGGLKRTRRYVRLKADVTQVSTRRYSLVSLNWPLSLPRVHVPVIVRLWEPMSSSFPSMTILTGVPFWSLYSASR